MSLQIRPYTYRGTAGYTLHGKPPGDTRSRRYFFPTREAAERHRDKLNAGREPQGMNIFRSPAERKAHPMTNRQASAAYRAGR